MSRIRSARDGNLIVLECMGVKCASVIGEYNESLEFLPEEFKDSNMEFSRVFYSRSHSFIHGFGFNPWVWLYIERKNDGDSGVISAGYSLERVMEE